MKQISPLGQENQNETDRTVKSFNRIVTYEQKSIKKRRTNF